MTREIPNRDKWFKVTARTGTLWSARQDWCNEHCQYASIPQIGTKITEFENEKDAFAFALIWA